MFKHNVTADPARKEEKGSLRLGLYFWTQTLVTILVTLILAFTLLGRITVVVGSSMVPTLHEGDILLLRCAGYAPRQGDVVVLTKPSPIAEGAIVKRVVATGGQHVTVDLSAGTVTVDGELLDEPYLNELMTDTGDPYKTSLDLTVPEGSIYVMGDNRNHSSDSRDQRLGTVDARYVLGQVLWVLLPFRNTGGVQ